MSEPDRSAEKVMAALSGRSLGQGAREVARNTGLSLVQVQRTLAALKRTGQAVESGSRWKAISSSVEPTATSKSPHTSPTGFELVRRVCAFHADVIQEVQSNKVRFEPDDNGLKDQVLVPIDWLQLGRGGVTIERSHLPKGFDASKPGRVRFSGPMHLIRRRKGKKAEWVWLPVFLVHAHTRKDSRTIDFDLDGEVQLNSMWLDEVFGSGDEDLRDDVLIRLGLLKEHKGGRLEHIVVKNLADCWDALLGLEDQLHWVSKRSLFSPDSGGRLMAERREGIHPHVILHREKISGFVKGLIGDLRRVAKASDEELKDTALAELCIPTQTDSGEGGGDVGAKATIAEYSTLNSLQEEAVRRSLSDRLSILQGPPGTGKSTVVRSALLSHGILGRGVLFGTFNNKAIDAVVDVMNPKEGDPGLVADVRNSDATNRWTRHLFRNLEAAPEDQSMLFLGLHEELAELEAKVSAILMERRRALAIGDEVLDLEGALADLASDLPDWAPRLNELNLKVPLSKLTSCEQDLQESTSMWRHWGARIRHWSYCRALRASWPDKPRPSTTNSAQLLSGFRMARCKSELEEELSRAAPLDDQAENLVALIEQKSQAIKDALPFLPATWAARVRDLSATLSELRREGSAKAKSAALRQQGVEAQNLIQLLPGLPLWACTLSSIPRAVPFVGGAFDLAIVDEAGQCNPASVLPLLFRAKRALFVGDPQQLRPVGSIARDKEDLLRRRHGLEGVDCSRFAFSGRSAFDLVADALIDRGVSGMRLREHYRCHPAIAAFFNSHFYGDDLIVRTSWREFSGQSGIKWTHVPGGSTTHQSSRWHAPQVESIVQELKELADNGFDGTVGVVTPFREQAKRIRDAAFAAIGARQAKKWEFIAETADKFQGGERDLVIFGLVGGGEGPSPTPPFYVRELNRFNVAVSRAKVLLHVFGDREWARKCEVEILRDLERRAHDNESEGRRPLRRNLIGPVWEPLLAETMRKQGLEFTQQYDTLGFYLDFAFLLEDGRKINVEVDGETYHRDSSGNLREEDVRRDLVLRANGWQVIRFWVYQLRDDLDSCILRIRKALRSP